MFYIIIFCLFFVLGLDHTRFQNARFSKTGSRGGDSLDAVCSTLVLWVGECVKKSLAKESEILNGEGKGSKKKNAGNIGHGDRAGVQCRGISAGVRR